jgi:hypothetical protein
LENAGGPYPCINVAETPDAKARGSEAALRSAQARLVVWTAFAPQRSADDRAVQQIYFRRHWWRRGDRLIAILPQHEGAVLRQRSDAAEDHPDDGINIRCDGCPMA